MRTVLVSISLLLLLLFAVSVIWRLAGVAARTEPETTATERVERSFNTQFRTAPVVGCLGFPVRPVLPAPPTPEPAARDRHIGDQRCVAEAGLAAQLLARRVSAADYRAAMAALAKADVGRPVGLPPGV